MGNQSKLIERKDRDGGRDVYCWLGLRGSPGVVSDGLRDMGVRATPRAHVLSQSNGRPLDPKSLEHRPNMQLCLRPGVCILGEGPVRSGRARLGRGDNPITYNANILIVLHVQHVRQ